MSKWGGNMPPRRALEPEVRLARMTGQLIADGGFDKAILPIGATEYHGPAFPYGTDAITAECLAEAFARELGRTVVLPALDYGVSHHHLPWPWTLSLRPDTLALVVRDIAESLLHHGIRKLLIVTAHDGNPPAATVAARNLSQDHGMEVALFSGWQGKSRKMLEGVRDIDQDHAGQSEMSMVLYAAPETARIDLATHQPNQRMDHPVDLIGGFDGTVPLGYSGNAAGGTAEEGEAIVRALCDLIVPFLQDLDANGWTRGSWLSGIEK
jgi:creatinine amidohydrolase